MSRLRNRFGLNGRPRRIRAINDRHRRDADAAGHADFLVALEQRVIEAAVGINLALQDVVLNASAAEVEHVALER